MNFDAPCSKTLNIGYKSVCKIRGSKDEDVRPSTVSIEGYKEVREGYERNEVMRS